MLNFLFIMISQIIESQAILLFVHNFLQLCLQRTALCSVQNTLKHGILNALSVIYTLFCNLTQPFSSGRCLCIHIIGNDD